MMLVTNGGGNNVDNHGYYAYGRDRRGSELRTAQRFTGHLTDGTGLIYMHARYYDPQLGQFISPDTLVPDATQLMDFNRYAYARGNPMKYNDPSGHQDEDPTTHNVPSSQANTFKQIVVDAAADLLDWVAPKPGQVKPLEKTEAASTQNEQEASEVAPVRKPSEREDRISTIELSGGSVYYTQTGYEGRVEAVSGNIEVADLGTGQSTTPAARTQARSMGYPTDQAGHVLGKNFGALLWDNIVSQDPRTNMGIYNKFEQRIANAMSQTGQSATFDIQVIYDSATATRPVYIIYQANVGGEPFSAIFENP